MLPPLDTPCVLCRRVPSAEDEIDPETGESRRVCRHCWQNYRLGRSLPRTRTLILREGRSGDFSWFGISGELVGDARVATDSPHTRMIIGLDGSPTPPPGCPLDRFVARRLMASIPVDGHGDPVWFVELARRATGDHLLAVLKADVDSLGVAIEQRLRGRDDLTDFLKLADSLDDFFAGELRHEIVPRSAVAINLHSLCRRG